MRACLHSFLNTQAAWQWQMIAGLLWVTQAPVQRVHKRGIQLMYIAPTERVRAADRKHTARCSLREERGSRGTVRTALKRK